MFALFSEYPNVKPRERLKHYFPSTHDVYNSLTAP